MDLWVTKVKFVYARDLVTKGKVVGLRYCNLEGCSGVRFAVRWPDKKLTWPCSKGMNFLSDDTGAIAPN